MDKLSRSLSDSIFIDGQQSGVMKALAIIRQYKLDIFNDEHIRAFTAVCEVEEKLQALKNLIN